MIKVAFVCHGNICRSPMAEFMFKKLVKEKGTADRFLIESKATSYEEIGNPVYPPARKLLNYYGINCSGKVAVHFDKEDYAKYDYILVMDNFNVRNIMRTVGSDPEGKITKLLDHTERGGEVADPWYTGDFKKTYDDILEGITAFYAEIEAQI